MATEAAKSTIIQFKAMRKIAGVWVTYYRGGQKVSLKVLPDHTKSQAITSSGTVVETRSRDYLILKSELVLAGDRVDPAAGDQIVEHMGRDRCVFEVFRPNNKSQPFAWSNSDGSIFRVHTQQIAESDASTSTTIPPDEE